MLLELTPKNGGTLAYVYRGKWSADTSFTRQDLRLLMPAAGAFSQPIAWQLRVDGGDEPTADVGIVTSPATRRTELISDGVTTPIQLDGDGFAMAHLPSAAAGTVPAYDARGALIGETAVPPFENDSSRAPGARRDTRLVD